jgi:hypothetical protein
MSDFWTSFLANLLADAILAFALYYILTQPGEKKKAQELRLVSLGLIKSELSTNEQRALTYLTQLDDIMSTLSHTRSSYRKQRLSKYFPFRFTRGAWNALREGGFLPNIDKPLLAYSLFAVNELTIVANRSLRRFELVTLGNEDGDPKVFATVARRDVAKLSSALTSALSAMRDVRASDQIPSSLELHDNDEDQEQPAEIAPKRARRSNTRWRRPKP